METKGSFVCPKCGLMGVTTFAEIAEVGVPMCTDCEETMQFYSEKMEETQQYGLLTLENPENLKSGLCNIGVQIAEDGIVWICKNGQSILRFKPLKP